MTTPARRITTLVAIGVLSFAVVAGLIWLFLWRPVRYVDLARGFSIRFSAEWVMLPEGAGANVRAARTLDNRLGGGVGVISVLASPVQNFPSSAAYRDWYADATSKSIKSYTRVTDGIRTTPAHEVPWILYQHDVDPGPTRVQTLQYFLVVDKTRGFIITCTSSPKDFDRFRLEFEDAVDSFKAD